MTKLLRVSALLTVIGLVFMVWSLVQPTPLPVLLAMSVGQAFGMLAFGIYLYVILVDLRRLRRERRDSKESMPP